MPLLFRSPTKSATRRNRFWTLPLFIVSVIFALKIRCEYFLMISPTALRVDSQFSTTGIIICVND